MVASGIGSASMISLGYYYGVGDRTEIRKSGYSNFILVLLLMIFSALIFISLRDILPALYVDDIEVIDMASFLLIIAGLFQLSDGVQAVGLGVLRGIRDTKIPTLVTFISYWIVAIPLTYLLGIVYGHGLIGVWVGLSIGLTIAAVLMLFVLIILHRSNSYENIHCHLFLLWFACVFIFIYFFFHSTLTRDLVSRSKKDGLLGTP